MGLNISDFWGMTPHRFNLVVEGYSKRKKIEQQERLAQAFYTARWVWAKRLSLKEILESTEPKEPMTDDQMMKMAMALNKLLGGEVIRDGD